MTITIYILKEANMKRFLLLLTLDTFYLIMKQYLMTS